MLHELRTVDRGGGGPREVERLVGGRVAGIFQTEVGETGQTIVITTHDDGHPTGADQPREGRFGPPELPGRLEVLVPAPFMRPWQAQELGRIWELTWCDFPTGSVSQALATFAGAFPRREQLYPLVGCWTVDVGSCSDRIYVLAPYKDWAHRDEVAAKLRGDPEWPPKGIPNALRAGNKLLIPASNSALH